MSDDACVSETVDCVSVWEDCALRDKCLISSQNEAIAKFSIKRVMNDLKLTCEWHKIDLWMTNDFWGFQSNLLVKMLGHKLDELKLQLKCQATKISYAKNLCPQKILGPYNKKCMKNICKK